MDSPYPPEKAPMLGQPAVARTASLASRTAKRRSRRAIQASLACLIIAAVGGAVTRPWGGWVSAGAFALVVTLTVAEAVLRLQETWYAGRAIAEAAKSLTWRYAVGGDPFPVDGRQDATASDEAYEARLGELRRRLAELPGDLPKAPPTGESDVVPSMLRAEDLAARRAAFRTGRLAHQIDWYDTSATGLSRSAGRWRWVAIGVQLLGLGGRSPRAWDGRTSTGCRWPPRAPPGSPPGGRSTRTRGPSAATARAPSPSAISVIGS